MPLPTFLQMNNVALLGMRVMVNMLSMVIVVEVVEVVEEVAILVQVIILNIAALNQLMQVMKVVIRVAIIIIHSNTMDQAITIIIMRVKDNIRIFIQRGRHRERWDLSLRMRQREARNSSLWQNNFEESY